MYIRRMSCACMDCVWAGYLLAYFVSVCLLSVQMSCGHPVCGRLLFAALYVLAEEGLCALPREDIPH